MRDSFRISTIATHTGVWLIVVLFWSLYSYFNSQNLGTSVANGLSDTVNYAIGYYVITWLLLPRLIRDKKVGVFVLWFVLLVLAVGLLRIQGYRLIRWYFDQPWKMSFSNYAYVFTTTTTILAASASIHLVIDRFRSERHLEKIRRENVTTELNFLKGQLNPHFLFNSLNTLYGNIDIGNDKARNILLKLSEMLRYQLYECNADYVEVAKEANYLRNYVALQALRADPDLEVTLTIAEDLNSMKLPPLLLAPFVENAFKYISQFKDRKNRIHISLSGGSHGLHFSVINTVEDMPSSAPNHSSGIGITNIRRRLELLYPGRHQLEIGKKGQEFVVNLQLQPA